MDSGSLVRETATGRAIGVLILTLYGLAWVLWGLNGAPHLLIPPTLVTAAAISLLLLVGAITLGRDARHLPPGTLPRAGKRQLGLRYGLIFGAEGIAIALVSVLCQALGHPEWLPAGVSLVVGLHFVPLASLFGLPLYYVTGAGCARSGW